MHPLDMPVWSALTTMQSDLALISESTRRFPPAMAAHGAIAEAAPQAFEALNRLSPEPVGLFFLDEPQIPPGWAITRRIVLVQMLHHAHELPETRLRPSAHLVELTEEDLPEMSHIYDLTRPGRRIAPQIQRLGKFLGVRREGRLLAMAGLRMHLPGYREITTVGTHPEHIGNGYATALVAALVRQIYSQGEQPFLSVRDDNGRAIAIYQRLGFRERRRFHYVMIRREQ